MEHIILWQVYTCYNNLEEKNFTLISISYWSFPWKLHWRLPKRNLESVVKYWWNLSCFRFKQMFLLQVVTSWLLNVKGLMSAIFPNISDSVRPYQSTPVFLSCIVSRVWSPNWQSQFLQCSPLCEVVILNLLCLVMTLNVCLICMKLLQMWPNTSTVQETIRKTRRRDLFCFN